MYNHTQLNISPLGRRTEKAEQGGVDASSVDGALKAKPGEISTFIGWPDGRNEG